MHQQIQSLDQCGIPSQMAQPIVICPIQLVYDAQTHTPMLLQHNEEHIQRAQPMLLNVQNTPPWIQNQTQNIIYYQQTPNQILPYLQPNMNRNPLFQTTYNFPQIISQESIRPVMQIPTLIQNDTIKNQPTNLNYPGTPTFHENMTQNPIGNINFNGATEKIPFVAQNQVNAALKAEMIQLNQLNTVPAIETMPNEAQNQINSSLRSGMKPILAQNQVNTISNVDVMPIVAQIQRKPKEKMPILTNLLNQNPLESENKPIMQNQHVQTDFSIAKTSNNTNIVANQAPQCVSTNNATHNNEKTIGIPQLNAIDTRQNYKAPNLYDQRYYVRPIRPNVTKNPEIPLHIRSKIQDTVNVRTIYRPILPRPVVRPYEFKGPNFVNPNFVTMRSPGPIQTMTIPNSEVMTNYTMINEDTNTLNGNNNNEIATKVHNITSMSGGTVINNNRKDQAQELEKYIENTDTIQSTNKVLKNKRNLIRIDEISIEEYEVVEYTKKIEAPIENEKHKSKESQSNLKPTIQTFNEIETQIKEKFEDKQKEKGNEKSVQETEKEINLNKKISNVNKTIEEMNNKNGIFVLTHVLDGHVIQESNVAFPIHKPVKEKITHEPYVTPDWQTDVEPLLPLKHLHIIDNENKGVENAVLEIKEDNDNPFSKLMKSTVEAWNMEQLLSHLTKHNWNETAIKLRDQEIDGESLLLASEQQLLNIGVSEKHAALISEFICKCV